MSGVSFSNYIKRKFDDKIISAIKKYVYNNNINIESNKLINVHFKELYDIEIINVKVFDEIGMKIRFDCIVSCEYHLKDMSNKHSDYDVVDAWFKVKCLGDLEKDLKDTIVVDVDQTIKQNQSIDALNDSLVPMLTKNELELKATEFLKLYYPDALTEPIFLDPEILIKNMNLNLKITKLSNDDSVFGQIYFKDGETNLYDSDAPILTHIKRGTILIDRDICFLRNFGSQNNTMVHECVHWHFHKKAFELERILNGDLSKIECRTSGNMKDFKNRNISSMEWQANALAPKILMPKNTFKQKAFELIKYFKKIKGTDETVDIIEPVINELATFFIVSKLSAKIRLLEVGYEEARGAFEFVNGKNVKPYTFKKEFLKLNQTFTIPYLDSIILRYTDTKFNELISNLDFKYVDGHYIINDFKYIKKNLFNEYELTSYARTHLDECAIPFDISFYNENNGKYDLECFLNRDLNSPVKIIFESANGDSLSQEELFKLRLERNKSEQKLLSSLPNNLVGSIEMLMRETNINKDDLCAYSGVDDRTMRRILGGETAKPKRDTIARICIGLQTSFPISMYLFNKAGHTLDEIDEDTILLKSALQDLSGCTIEEFERIVNPHLKNNI